MPDSLATDLMPVIAGASPAAHPVMTALARGIPVTLLMDLLVVDGDLAADPSALGSPIAVLIRGEPPVIP